MTAIAVGRFPAIGVVVEVAVTDPAALGRAVEVVAAEVDALDRACSRFRTDSELSLLNAAGGEPFPAGPLLVDAVRASLRAAASTGGDVDPTVGRSMRGLGWDRDFAVVVSSEAPHRIHVVPAGGWRRVRLDEERCTIQLPPGVELDLGATAKAFAADRCARLAHDATGAGVLVGLGGDLAVAGAPPPGGFSVRVTGDHRDGPGAPGPVVALRDGGLATSSTAVRRWVAGGAERHHIVDPHTGLPATETWRTVTVAAATCVEANTASTAAVVRGERAAGWLEELGLPARLVHADGTVVTTGGWPHEATEELLCTAC